MSKTPISSKTILIAILLILIFTLITLADAPRPEFGIIDLYIYNEKIVADNYWDTFCSEDGGFSWKNCDFSEEDRLTLLYRETNAERQINIPDSKIAYRINDKNLIQKSEDSGQTWKYVYFDDDLSSVDIYYLENHYPYGYCEGDILYDSKSGNTLFAMGHNGIILIDENNKFLQISIEDYTPVERESDSLYNKLIAPFIYPSVIIIIILFSIHTLGYKNVWYWFAIFFSLGIWLYSLNSYWAILNNPEFTTSSAMFSILIILLFVLFLFSIVSFLALIQTHKTKWYIPLLGSLPAGPLFYLAYALWFKEIIPSYNWALAISLGIIVLFIVYAIYQSYQLNKSLEK
jgi:hypothetical protein